ncbi:MAG: hypothetical protein ACOC2W_04060, partial [bacterium]
EDDINAITENGTSPYGIDLSRGSEGLVDNSSSDDSKTGNNPDDNNTDLEGSSGGAPVVDIPALGYKGPYNEDFKEFLDKYNISPDVQEGLDILAKTASEEDFNLYLNAVLKRGMDSSPRPLITYDKDLKGIGLQIEVNMIPGTYGVELIFFLEENPFTGESTNFDRTNFVEAYIYGGASLSDGLKDEILKKASNIRTFDVSGSIIVLFGDDQFNDVDDYTRWFNTGSVTISNIKGSYAADPQGHVSVFGLGGSSSPFGISVGKTFYSRIEQEKIYRYFSESSLNIFKQNSLNSYKKQSDQF